MFERPQHRTVLAVLESFRADVLSGDRFLFGGGTRIVLDLDEYRVSQDVDFLCSDAAGYGDLRFEATTGEKVLLLSHPGELEPLIPLLRQAVARAGGVDLGNWQVLGTEHPDAKASRAASPADSEYASMQDVLDGKLQ